MVDQPEPLTAILDGPGKRSVLPRGWRFCDHDMGAGIDEGVCWKSVVDTVDPPAGDVGLNAHLVEEFHVFPGFRRTARIVLDLIEDDHGVLRSQPRNGHQGRQECYKKQARNHMT